MKNKRKALEIISQKLKGIPWAIYSGTAIEIYTNGKRKGRDIDIIVAEDKIDEVGRRFKVKPILKTREKERVKIVNDYYVETKIAGFTVEFIGNSEKFIIDGEEYKPASPENSRKLFKKVKKMEYLGVQVNVVPIEEILAQKMIMQRIEWQDEEDIKLLRKQKISRKALLEAFNRWRVAKKSRKSI